MKRWIPFLLSFCLIFSAFLLPAGAAETPDVTVDYDTGAVTVTVSGNAGDPATIRIEKDAKRYYLDSTYLDETGAYTFRTVLPLDMEFDAAVNVAGTVTSFPVSTIRPTEPPAPPTPPTPPAKKTVTLSVDTKTVNDSYILEPTAVEITENDTVWTVLKRELDARGIPYKASESNDFQTVYVSSIGGFGEMDHGPLSGWMYNVNGVYPQVGCSQYVLHGGESIQWRYTLDMGADIGGGGAVTPPDPETPDVPAEKELPFTDVPKEYWAYDGIRFVYEKGLMKGTSETEFSPEAVTSRGMIAAILYRMEGSPAVSGTQKFADVPADLYCADAVIWAEANGILLGYGDGTFGPDDDITREQMAAVLYRYAGYKGCDLSAKADLSTFADAGEISTWAYDALAWANKQGLIKGTGETMLSPGGDAARAQVAVILMRYLQNIIK